MISAPGAAGISFLGTREAVIFPADSSESLLLFHAENASANDPKRTFRFRWQPRRPYLMFHALGEHP
jgi:hypothetical protein